MIIVPAPLAFDRPVDVLRSNKTLVLHGSTEYFLVVRVTVFCPSYNGTVPDGC